MADPSDPTLANEPAEPIDSTDPVEPTESRDSALATLRTELRERIDHHDGMVLLSDRIADAVPRVALMWHHDRVARTTIIII